MSQKFCHAFFKYFLHFFLNFFARRFKSYFKDEIAFSYLLFESLFFIFKKLKVLGVKSS